MNTMIVSRTLHTACVGVTHIHYQGTHEMNRCDLCIFTYFIRDIQAFAPPSMDQVAPVT